MININSKLYKLKYNMWFVGQSDVLKVLKIVLKWSEVTWGFFPCTPLIFETFQSFWIIFGNLQNSLDQLWKSWKGFESIAEILS